MTETVITSITAVIVAAVGTLSVLIQCRIERDRKKLADSEKDRRSLWLLMIRQLDAQGRLTEICAKRLAGIALNGDVHEAMESACRSREAVNSLVQSLTSRHI